MYTEIIFCENRNRMMNLGEHAAVNHSMRIAEGARAKTLRQKDWILTKLWKADICNVDRLHRRSNLLYWARNLSGKVTEA